VRKISCLILYVSLCLTQGRAQTSQDALDLGTVAFRSAHFAEAAQHFQDAVNADPNDVKAHLYLATAFEMQYVPGLDSSENRQFADHATAEFQKVLSLDPKNVMALASMASLAWNQNRFDDSRDWNLKVLAVNPQNKEAYYTLGVIAWREWLPVDRQARIDSGQAAESPGPISNSRMRLELKAKWLPILDAGIRNEEEALRIDPNYDDAMAYLNLLIRYRADLLDTPEEYTSETQRADEWITRATEAKKAKSSGHKLDVSLQQAPPSPGAPPGTPPKGIRIGGTVAQASLISQVAPVYPELARKARIQGTVRFNVRIDKEGHVEDVRLISGHPLLVQSALDSVKQWVYKPTLLNGEPVNVLTTVDVNFTLSN
jgi:TonB family protein